MDTPLDRFRLRRRMALWSFGAILAEMAAVLLLVFLGGEYMGEKLLQAGAILAPITACLTALIWKYFGDVTRTDLEEMRNDSASDDRGGRRPARD